MLKGNDFPSKKTIPLASVSSPVCCETWLDNGYKNALKTLKYYTDVSYYNDDD